jgi:hypothetical protein
MRHYFSSLEKWMTYHSRVCKWQILHKIITKENIKSVRSQILCRKMWKGLHLLFFLIRILGVESIRVHSARLPLLAYCTCPGWLWRWRVWWNENWQGKPMYSEKTCPSATSSTINLTWPDSGSNPGRRGGKLATNRLIT